MTMFATAPYGELNHSNNPTYLDSTETQGISTGSLQYMEQPRKIKNIVESAFLDVEPDFIKTTVRKTEEKQYTFKLKIDI